MATYTFKTTDEEDRALAFIARRPRLGATKRTAEDVLRAAIRSGLAGCMAMWRNADQSEREDLLEEASPEDRATVEAILGKYRESAAVDAPIDLDAPAER